MGDQNQLGAFLRTRRERVQPGDVGLPPGSGVRRTPGLRREELAALAGVSVDYYTRVERGRERRPSSPVLDSLARVLRLTEPEREHLHALAARAARSVLPDPAGSCPAVRQTTRLLLETLRPNPAFVVGRVNELLAANPGALALFPGLTDWPEDRRNLSRYMFLHPAARSLYEEWDALACGSVAHLRAVAGAAPDAPDIAALVGELILHSAEFARIWNRYDVLPRSSGVKAFRHPLVGRMRLGYESLPVAGTHGQRLIVYLAEPGTPDHDALVLLDMAGAAEHQVTEKPPSTQSSCPVR